MGVYAKRDPFSDSGRKERDRSRHAYGDVTVSLRF